MNTQNVEPVTLSPEYDSVAVCGETSLNAANRLQLAIILYAQQAERGVIELLSPEPEIAKPEGKRMGVWVDGKLRFQSRDSDAIYDYAERKMRPYTKVINREAHVITHDVWIAPIGSFKE